MTGSCVSSWMLCVVMGGRLEAPWANTQRLSLTMSFFDRRSEESGMLPRRQISYMRWPEGKQEKVFNFFPEKYISQLTNVLLDFINGVFKALRNSVATQ